MALLSRKGLLAIAAVIDVALHGRKLLTLRDAAIHHRAAESGAWPGGKKFQRPPMP